MIAAFAMLSFMFFMFIRVVQQVDDASAFHQVRQRAREIRYEENRVWIFAHTLHFPKADALNFDGERGPLCRRWRMVYRRKRHAPG